MKNQTDKELAVFMLATRQSGGQSRKDYWKRHKRSLILFFVVVALVLAGAFIAHYWWACWLMLGVVYGIFRRDYVLMRAQKAAWPFYDKVIDGRRWRRLQMKIHGLVRN